jgi:hypothetical protein
LSIVTSSNLLEVLRKAVSICNGTVVVVSFKLTQTGKRFMFGLSRASDAGSTTYSTIDYAIYITGSSVQIYENASMKGGYPLLEVLRKAVSICNGTVVVVEEV